MKIAIFNENLKESEYLKNLIYIFSNLKKIELVVEIFSDPTELLKKYEDFELFFISYNSPLGILLSRKLSKINSKKSMIITADNSLLAVEAFKINAYNFLKFPISSNQLFSVLHDFIDTYLSENLLLNIGLENICINTQEILYIEANNKHCTIHIKNDNIYYKKTMARVLEALPQDHFIKISRSIAVNSNYISKFSSKIITLKNGTTLHPSRHFYKNFKCDYLRIQSPIIP